LLVDVQSQQGRDIDVNGNSGFGFNNVNVRPRIDNPGSGPVGANWTSSSHPWHHSQTPGLQQVVNQINGLI